MKFYIATKLENHAAHNVVRDALQQAGHEITYDWTTHGPVYRHGLDRVREVSVLETQGVLDAGIVVVLWPGGRGTHVELGMAIAASKEILFFSDLLDHHIAPKRSLPCHRACPLRPRSGRARTNRRTS